MEISEEISGIQRGFEDLDYVTDLSLATTIFLMTKLKKPVLIEGQAGVGKTEVGKVLASYLSTNLIRLQCYEGLDVNSALYEWNYQKQLLAIKLQEGVNEPLAEKEKHIFSEEFLLERPLLQSIRETEAPPVLLIDEIDRADEEFEAFLLEILSEFQVSIPELGTIEAVHIPFVILTSNQSRELSEALRRRCLYYYMNYPDSEKELQIINRKVPEIEEDLAKQIVSFIQKLRDLDISKPPGVSESLDWAMALLSLNKKELDEESIEETLGITLKSNEDAEIVKELGSSKPRCMPLISSEISIPFATIILFP